MTAGWCATDPEAAVRGGSSATTAYCGLVVTASSSCVLGFSTLGAPSRPVSWGPKPRWWIRLSPSRGRAGTRNNCSPVGRVSLRFAVGGPLRRRAITRHGRSRELEDGEDGPAQLLVRGLREVLAGLPADQSLVRSDEPGQVCCVQAQVVRRAPGPFEVGQGVLEQGAVDTHHRGAEHLHEPTVGIPREAFVPGHLRQAEDGAVVKADVEDRLHHAGHGEPCPGADGQQQRVVRLPQPPSGGLLQGGQVRGDLTAQTVRLAAGGQEGPAGVGGHGEAGRHRQAHPGHLGQVRALATEQIGLVAAAFCEVVHVTDHDAGLLRRASGWPGTGTSTSSSTGTSRRMGFTAPVHRLWSRFRRGDDA